ncbi:MAG: Smr/MutS family protein [Gammaproteobacteria bacterium]|nr:Smr/MutS family protein [Gammaproteobacteria bacterium]
MSDDSTKDDEESLFLSEMADVTPLKSDNKIKLKKKLKKPLRQTSDDDYSFAIDDVFSSAEMVEDCPDILSFSRSGLQHNVLKKLRQGKNPIEHALDLHGLTVEQARNELLGFLGECEAAGVRNAIIVHGKGFRSKDKPVIKPMVNRWLRAVDNVLAFHSAQPKDGGSGAVYVLLKKL